MAGVLTVTAAATGGLCMHGLVVFALHCHEGHLSALECTKRCYTQGVWLCLQTRKPASCRPGCPHRASEGWWSGAACEKESTSGRWLGAQLETPTAVCEVQAERLTSTLQASPLDVCMHRSIAFSLAVRAPRHRGLPRPHN